MRSLRIPSLVVVSAVLAGELALGEPSPEEAVGQPAPTLSFVKSYNCTGLPTNDDLKGKAVIIEFYDTR